MIVSLLVGSTTTTADFTVITEVDTDPSASTAKCIYLERYG